ncbi:hypothetical protein PG2113B_0281 [Bifidobacterium pseudolongum subsp. globosum]|uniref:hypothetical protein n=1 Tax=Bifidobacterium pseudolongum TaxID=1694 RepID=UPI00102133FD|nr:hypothetical protein [Bifidobacterium pseudolongum]RYQ05358.1 hypothetical protein PG2113B_0281 [Bifidobacterium pseudolongum subsp. globosum]RYQ10818.1 hypothetical protein PG2098B_0280 [Bifidobacterium pseudolongum subsp. globosum]RYQ15151.1 hypothetical protein PG2088B_0280 [Bifidobacterium pseudolongum subsp. globosum]RYQ16798.1 hypothetical protein PG2086B_0280 [Bifidobacterium pseudolongum subsp. globosum]
MNNDNYFEAMRELWLAYGGEPDEELHPEDYGRYAAARMGEARRPDSRLSEFDEWARKERREQGTADDLRGVRVALERIADAVEAQRLNHAASLTVGELMDGVNFDSDPQMEELNTEGATRTSYIRLAIEDLGFGLEVRAYDDGPVEAYGDATAEWSFRSPEDVRALASAFRTKYATLLDMAAERWERGLRNGSIQTGEAAA